MTVIAYSILGFAYAGFLYIFHVLSNAVSVIIRGYPQGTPPHRRTVSRTFSARAFHAQLYWWRVLRALTFTLLGAYRYAHI